MINILPASGKKYFEGIFTKSTAEFVELPFRHKSSEVQQNIIIEEPAGENEFTVGAIMKRKSVKGVLLWQVKWQGYDDLTWEPEQSFIDTDGRKNDV